jgi:5-methylcytosine-specific restriction endonuclease McrBC regulatory subunit McrC
VNIVEAQEREFFEVSASDADYLAARLRGNFERHGHLVRIARHVGHMRLPSGTVLRLRTGKAPATSLLAWLAYVDPALAPAKLLDLVPEAASDGDVGAALAWLYVTELQRAMTESGLIRRYQRTTSRNGTVRGRIDFTALVRQGGDLARLPCSVWERQTRSPLNETLRAALEVVQRSELMRDVVRRSLPPVLAAFSDVSPRADAQLLSGALPLSRTEERFATSLRLARLLLKGAALCEGDRHVGIGYLLNIEQLFEDAVVRALRDAGHRVEAQYPLDYGVETPPGSGLNSFFVDAYCISNAGDLVVDAKFKREVSAANLQQMVAYCFMSGAIRAALVLPAEFAKSATYTFAGKTGHDAVNIHVVGMRVDGTSLSSWRDAGSCMAEEVHSLMLSTALVDRRSPQ